MKKPTYKDVAIEAARAAGKIHKKYFHRDIKVKTKGASYDLLTIADTEAEKAVVSVIKKYFPEHNFLGEENRYAKTDSAYTWVIDPLDGTNNFSSGMPIFCVSVALVKNGESIVGVVYDVTRDELFSAVKGHGAYLNGKRMKVSDAKTLKDSLLITGFYYDRGKLMRATLDNIHEFFQKPIRGLRRLGAAALDLCYIASGRAAGFWEFQLSPWDFAAGKLLVEEAGGKVTDDSGKKVSITKSYVVASNGTIHAAMLKVLKRKK
ncbi:inositol monophosphatase family protein [Candidatus Omnitrophota bacterium]